MSYPGDSALASDVQQRILTTFQQTLELASKGSRQEALLGCDFILRLDTQFEPARRLQQMVNAGREGAEIRAAFAPAGPGALDPAAAQARAEAEPYVRAFLDKARAALAVGDSAEAGRMIAKARALDATHPEIDAVEAESSGDAGGLGGLDLPEVDFGAPGGDSLFGDEAGGGESGGRIQELLDEGQAAFSRGEYQNAIDAWSRIFLIDIDHHEAARRIEEARRLKAEREREVEELFHGGVAQFDAGDFGAAEHSFGRVLAIAPGYVVAQEYLDKITERRAGSATMQIPLPPVAGDEAPAAPESAARSEARAARRSSSEILVPPEPGSSRDREGAPGYGAAASKKGSPSRNFALIGGLVLALLLAGGWLLLKNRSRLFPNAKEAPEAKAAAAVDPIARARALQQEGKVALALAQLKRIPPQDASYAEAQSLISQWEAITKPAEPVPASLPPGLKARRDGFLAAAATACPAGRNLLCKRALEGAATVLPLDATRAADLATANANLAPIETELRFYADGEYEQTLNRLWRVRDERPDDPDVRQLIVDSYYNLGILELQRADPAAAADRFREARALDPADRDLERMESFANTYTQRREDLLFQIFVRNLVNR